MNMVSFFYLVRLAFSVPERILGVYFLFVRLFLGFFLLSSCSAFNVCHICALCVPLLCLKKVLYCVLLM